MTNDRKPKMPPSIESWRGEFMQAASRHASHAPSWKRRLVAPLVAVAVIGAAGVATAEIIDRFDGPYELPPFQGETHGYLDLETREPIRCGDGELLTYIPPAGSSNYGEPKCADGSVPAVYDRQLKELTTYLDSGAEVGAPVTKPGTRLTDAPYFSFVLLPGDE